MKNLTPSLSTRRIANATAAGTTNIDCVVVDTYGYDAVRCVALLGALTATQVTRIEAYQSSVVDGTGDPFVLIAQTANALDADGNKTLILEICEPLERYIKFRIVRGTANAVVDGVIAELFRASIKPVIADASVSAQTVYSS